MVQPLGGCREYLRHNVDFNVDEKLEKHADSQFDWNQRLAGLNWLCGRPGTTVLPNIRLIQSLRLFKNPPLDQWKKLRVVNAGIGSRLRVLVVPIITIVFHITRVLLCKRDLLAKIPRLL